MTSADYRICGQIYPIAIVPEKRRLIEAAIRDIPAISMAIETQQKNQVCWATREKLDNVRLLEVVTASNSAEGKNTSPLQEQLRRMDEYLSELIVNPRPPRLMHEEAARQLKKVAAYYFKKGLYQEAHDIYQEERQCQEAESFLMRKAQQYQNQPIRPLTVSEFKDRMSRIYSEEGFPEEEFHQYQEDIRRQEYASVEEHQGLFKSIRHIARCQFALKRYPEALESYQKVCRVSTVVFGCNSRETVGALKDIALVLRKLKEFDKAKEILQQVFEIEQSWPETQLSFSDFDFLRHLLSQIYIRGLEPEIRKELTVWLTNILDLEQEIEKGAAELFELDKEVVEQWDTRDEATAKLFTEKAFVYFALGDKEKCLTILERAVMIKRSLYRGHEKEKLRSAESLTLLATAQQRFGLLEEAMANYRDSLNLLREFYGDHPDIATVLRYIGQLQMLLGRCKPALAYCKAALDMKRDLKGTSDQAARGMVRDLNAVGTLLSVLGRFQGAKEHFQEALVLLNSPISEGKPLQVAFPHKRPTLESLKKYFHLFAGPIVLSSDVPIWDFDDSQNEDVLTASSLNAMGNIFEDLGQFAECLEYQQRALYRLMHSGWGEHPLTFVVLDSLGSVLCKLGHFKLSAQCYHKALGVQRRFWRGFQFELRNNLGAILEELGAYQEALDFYEKMLIATRKYFKTNDHPSVARILKNLGHLLQILGRDLEALTKHEEAYVIYQKVYGSIDHPEIAETLRYRGDSLRVLGRFVESRASLEKSLEMSRRIFNSNEHPKIAATLSSLSETLKEQGEFKEAIARCEEAVTMDLGAYGFLAHPQEGRRWAS